MPRRLTRASAETRQKYRSVTSHFVPVVRGRYKRFTDRESIPHPLTARVPSGHDKVSAVDGALRSGRKLIGDNQHVSWKETEKELEQWQRQLRMTSGMIQELASQLKRLQTTLPPSSPQQE